MRFNVLDYKNALKQNWNGTPAVYDIEELIKDQCAPAPYNGNGALEDIQEECRKLQVVVAKLIEHTLGSEDKVAEFLSSLSYETVVPHRE